MRKQHVRCLPDPSAPDSRTLEKDLIEQQRDSRIDSGSDSDSYTFHSDGESDGDSVRVASDSAKDDLTGEDDRELST